MEKFTSAFRSNQGRKIVLNIQLNLPTRFFLRQFEMSTVLTHRRIQSFPVDIEDDFRFEFATKGLVIQRFEYLMKYN